MSDLFNFTVTLLDSDGNKITFPSNERKDNQSKTKNLKETNQVLEACRKKYQKWHHENETLKKIIEQQEELQKCQNQLKN